MSSIDKLLINGFRSYCHITEQIGLRPEERQQAQVQQTITFQRPVTLIWGHNGAGKTTIIECLKLATTGLHPPNSDRGRTFVTDSQLLRQTETQAQVQLEFSSLNNLPMTVRRHYKVANYANSTSINAIRSTLHYRHPQTGELQSLSQTCIEMDTKIPQLLGVSTSILTHVIFCHQEDSFWVFSENLTLKKIFDELFDTTKFAKLQDWIKDTIKAQTSELKKITEKIGLAKRDVDDSVRSREHITKDLLGLYNEGVKLKSGSEVVEHLAKRCDPLEQRELQQRLNEKQEKISILKYRIQVNEEKIRDVEISTSEKKLQEEREIHTKQSSTLTMQLDKVKSNLQRSEREIDIKRQEMQALDESDNVESALKQELKQLKTQAIAFVALQRNDTEAYVLKQLQNELNNLQQRLRTINEQNRIPALQQQHTQLMNTLNEHKASYNFIQSTIAKLNSTLQQTSVQISRIKSALAQTSRYDTLVEERNQLKQALEDLAETYYTKQSKLSKIQQELTALNQKPILEYQDSIKELRALQQQIKDKDREIEANSLRIDNYDDTRANLQRQLQSIKSKAQAQQLRISEINCKEKLYEEQIQEMQKSSLPKNLQQLKSQMEDVKKRYRTTKDDLIKVNYSSGEFIDQYIQLARDRAKCILCYKGLDAADIKGVLDRRNKQLPKITERIEQMQKTVATLKQEKATLKKSFGQYDKYRDLESRIEDLTIQVSLLEEERKKLNIDYSTEEREIENQLYALDRLYPIITQRNMLQNQFDMISHKVEQMLRQNPKLAQEQNPQNQVETLQREQSQLYREVSEQTIMREQLTQKLKQCENEMKATESQNAIKQRDLAKLPELEDRERTNTLELVDQEALLVETSNSIEEVQKQIDYVSIQITQATEQRDQSLSEVQAGLPVLQHIIPLYERTLEKLNEVRKLKQGNQSQYIEHQRDKLKKDIETSENNSMRAQELQRKLEILIAEHDVKLKQVECQLEALGIAKQNKSMIKDINDLLTSLESERTRLEELHNIAKERDRREAQLTAERTKVKEHFHRTMEQRVIIISSIDRMILRCGIKMQKEITCS